MSGKTAFQGNINLPALSATALNELKRQDTEQEGAQEEGRLRIGVGRPFEQPIVVGPQIIPGAEWPVLPNGWRIWAAQVTSPGAVGMRVHLEWLNPPPGARLIAYDPAKPASKATPITLEGLYGEQQVWTETVFAERVAIECQLPPRTDPSKARFALTGVSHLYRLGVSARQAAYCELDVSCYPDWAEEAAGVARITYLNDLGEAYLCTGCLINTSPSTFVNYFLTANHCIPDQTTASTLELFWFYQTSVCDGFPPFLQNVPSTSGGADLLATLSKAVGNDFSFLRLRQSVPGGVTYEGWETTGPAAQESLTGIHHPAGDYKRISFGNPVDNDSDFWHIQWFSGLTEGGSSGSPLFNANKQVIGQLWGATPPNCLSQSQTAQYGRFDVTFSYIKQWIEPSSCATLGATTPTAPNCGASDASTTPMLSWAAVANASGYLVQIFSDNSCGGTPLQTSPELSADTTSWVVPGEVGLQSGQTYSWQVQAIGDGVDYCDGPWSSCCSFSIPYVPPFTPIKGTYTGLFEDDVNGVSQGSAGLFTLSTTARGAFSGKLQIGGAHHSISGTFDDTGQATSYIFRRNQNSLTVSLQMYGTDLTIGTVSDGTFVAQLLANRAIFDARSNIAPEQGAYTMYFAGDYGATTDPAGDGWATVKVDGAGNLHLAGSLSDGTKITQVVMVASDGTWPLYLSLYGGQGLVQGWVAFSSSSGDDISSDSVTWIKPASRSGYPAGFTAFPSVRGSLYSAPPRGATLLGVTNAYVTFEGGDLAQAITDQVTIGANNRVVNLGTTKLSLSFSLAMGTFIGRITDPSTKVAYSFSGVVLPNYDIGRGYFLGPHQSGEVQFSPPSSP
ncbi:putative Lysyl endopeptidase [Verrucomicrobia bacterium]|nr:putative Lysyl endopeptidase [Verrucomicrobiota bacterium]